MNIYTVNNIKTFLPLTGSQQSRKSRCLLSGFKLLHEVCPFTVLQKYTLNRFK